MAVDADAGKPDFALEAPIEDAPRADGLLTRRQLADVLNVNAQTVTKWHEEGIPIEVLGSRGVAALYSLEKVRAWRDEREQQRRESVSGDTNQARAQKDYWQAQLAKQQHQIRSKELLHVEDVEKLWASEVGAVRAAILNSYVTASDRVYRASKVGGLAAVEKELKTIAHEILRELENPQRPMVELPDRTPPPFELKSGEDQP